jgi:nitrilase
MPLLRQSLYSQNVNLYLAPTADGRDSWLPLMRTVAFEGRAVVLSANQCVRRSELPSWITRTAKARDSLASGRPSRGTTDRPTLGQRRPRSVTTLEGLHEIVWPQSNTGTAAQPEFHTEIDATLYTPEKESPEVLTSGTTGDAISHRCRTGEPSLSPARSSPSVSPQRGQTGFKCRRRSIITEDHHEITWPDTDSRKVSRNDPGPVISDPYLTAGGSCIINPFGQVVAGPIWNVSDDDQGSLLVVEVDFEDCVSARLDLDIAGSCSRNDAFTLKVEGLDLNPPPT